MAKLASRDAQRERTLDAVVDTGLLALGQARHERKQAYDQVIAVGFDLKGTPTWSRVLEHFRAIDILLAVGECRRARLRHHPKYGASPLCRACADRRR